MSDNKTIKTSAELGNEIVSAIDEYLHHHTKYATDVEVGVNPTTFEVLIESPGKIPADFRRHSIADFILINERGMYEPDEKMAFAAAESYF